MDRLDAVVVGGGPAGSAFAITLAAAGRAVAVLDRRAGAAPGRGGDVLPPEVRPVLEELGVWDRFRADGHLPTPGMVSVWGGTDPVPADHIWNPYGDAWHVDRERFDGLLRAAAERAGATVHGPHRVTGATGGAEGWEVDYLAVGATERLRADFLVQATGRSLFPSHPAAPSRTAVDHLVGLVATFDVAPGLDDFGPRMLLEATENGWWYSAPIPGQRLVVAHMTDSDLGRDRSDPIRAHWRHDLGATVHTGARVPAHAAPTPRVVAANSGCRRAAVAARRWLAVGDAASSYDPLSGQGIIHALRTGQAAARSVIATQAGRTSALEDYADAVAEEFRRYLRLRREYYSTERRWPASPFWLRRHLLAAPVTSTP